MSRLYNFVFTINNYLQEDIDLLDKLDCQYLIYGKEIGESGTPHLQGYCELLKQERFSAVKKWLPRAHIEIRKGKQEQAIVYCMKEDKKPYQRGTPRMKQGTRTDLDFARELAIDQGMRAVTATCNYQQIKVAEKYLSYNEEPRDWPIEVIWITGPPGCGKSRLAHEMCPDAYWKDSSIWWDGYDGHEDVILDDYRDSWWDLDYTLRVLQTLPFLIQFKGGYRQLRGRKFIITSVKEPMDCYAALIGEPHAQFLRRIHQIIRLPSLAKK